MSSTSTNRTSSIEELRNLNDVAALASIPTIAAMAASSQTRAVEDDFSVEAPTPPQNPLNVTACGTCL